MGRLRRRRPARGRRDRIVGQRRSPVQALDDGPRDNGTIQALIERWCEAITLIETRSAARVLPGTRWGIRTFTVAHIRRSAEALAAALSLRFALHEGTEQDRRDHEDLERLIAGLPRTSFAWLLAALFVVVVGLSQLTLEAVDWALSSVNADVAPVTNFSDDLAKIADAEPASVVEVLTTVRQADPRDLTFLVLAVSLTLYVLLRGPAAGSALAHRALNDANEVECRVFAQLRVSRPREFPFDLAIKALILIGPAVIALFGVITVVTGSAAAGGPVGTIALVALVLAIALRSSWLMLQGHRRGAVLTPLWLGFAASAGLALALATHDYRDPLDAPRPSGSAAERREFLSRVGGEIPRVDAAIRAQWIRRQAEAAVLDSRDNLSGLDFRNRNLAELDLSRKDLSAANLDGANLAGADLSQSDLRRASLRDSNMAGALLAGTRLEGAQLAGANLRGAEFDRKTRWPEGFAPGDMGAKRP
jgi:Pentapeptide repeats (8 copies)